VLVVHSQLTEDIRYKHRKYGVRCRYCDTKWPCDAIKIANENDDLRIDLYAIRIKIEKTKLKGSIMIVTCLICQRNMYPLATQAHAKRGNAHTSYRCTDCECCVLIIDDINATKQRVRELEIEANTRTDDEPLFMGEAEVEFDEEFFKKDKS
jgi:hypothetical protein